MREINKKRNNRKKNEIGIVNKILDYREEADVSTSRCNRLLVDPSSLSLDHLFVSVTWFLSCFNIYISFYLSAFPSFAIFTEKKETESICLISFRLDRNNLSVSIPLCSRDLLPVQQTTQSSHGMCVPLGLSQRFPDDPLVPWNDWSDDPEEQMAALFATIPKATVHALSLETLFLSLDGVHDPLETSARWLGVPSLSLCCKSHTVVRC